MGLGQVRRGEAWLCGGCGAAERREAKAREARRLAEIREYYEQAGDLRTFEIRYGRK